MRRRISALLPALLLATMVTAGCTSDEPAVTDTTDTAAASAQEPKKDFATRVGDTVGTATANAEKMKEEENERVDEVNQAMDE